jgi:hypothetical protein
MTISFSKLREIYSGHLIREAKIGAYNDEHAHVRIWNHMTSLGIAHDKEAMKREFDKAKTNKKHPLNFDNAKDNEGFVGGKKTEAHRESYHNGHHIAIHTIHAIANHPEFKTAIKEGHVASVTGGNRDELSPIWKHYGATKGATSKTDIAISYRGSATGEGIRLSMKKGGGSQLMSAGSEENNAVHHVSADEMLRDHPNYAHLPEEHKAKIHADIMTRVQRAGKHANAMRDADGSDLNGLKLKMQKEMNDVHKKYPELAHYVRKEATTGRGKFGKDSPSSANYIVKSSTKTNAPSVKNVEDMEFKGPGVRAALPKGMSGNRRRSGNFKLDE